MSLTLSEIAKKLNKNEKELEAESLKIFLENKIKELRIEKSVIMKKYGIKNYRELEEKLKNGELSEKECGEDYLNLCFLESNLNKLSEMQ